MVPTELNTPLNSSCNHSSLSGSRGILACLVSINNLEIQHSMASGLICVAFLVMANTFAVEARILKPRQLYTGPGSTRNLTDIILGRCAEYLLIDAHKSLVPEGMPLPCNDIWYAFQSAFAYKDPCKPGSYESFVELTWGPYLRNKALFWSGTMDLATQYADNGRRKVILGNLLAGYLVKDNLNWCGTTDISGDGINYENCPSYSECNSQGGFWTDLSAMMAERARGVAYVLLNGTRSSPAYDKNSFFATVELPNLRNNVVKKVVALLAHDIDRTPYEVCDEGSLQDLEKDVTSRGFSFKCIDNPRDVKHLLCVDAPNSKECRFSRYYSG